VLIRGLLAIVLLFANLTIFAQKGLTGQYSPGSFNHHLHNFKKSSSHLDSRHAIEMGYTAVLTSKPSGTAYDGLHLIYNYNGRTAPFRIIDDNGTLYVYYFGPSGENNYLASLHGMTRANAQNLLMNEDDFNLLIGYAAAEANISELEWSGLTMQDIKDHFIEFYCNVDGSTEDCLVTLNYSSKAVVNNVYACIVANYSGGTEGVYIDDMKYHTPGQAYNSTWGGEGEYSTWAEGRFDFFTRLKSYLGYRKIIVNVYDPVSSQVLSGVAKWYADGDLRFDHYYYEKGGLGTQTPNGTDPETGLPAYTDGNTPPDAYIPANRVSLDDVARYCQFAPCVAADHFDQHLDACGTAGDNGAWFGWYGEDSVLLKFKDELLYTNDLQLLRAVPNWDNIAEIPLDDRIWENKSYQSSNSYASPKVIYSKNPMNNEMYVVFRSMDGTVELPSGEKIEAAYFVDEMFKKTNEDALLALDVNNSTLRLKRAYAHKLLTGIRITFIADSLLHAPCNFIVEK